MTEARFEKALARSRPTGRDLAIHLDCLCTVRGMQSDAAWARSVAQLAARAGRSRDGLDGRERRMGMEIGYGSIRRRRTLEWCISAAAGRPMESIDALAMCILRTAVYQLMFMTRVPAHSVVSEAVDAAKRFTHSGIASFVNAVLRKISTPGFDPRYPAPGTDIVKHLAVTLSYPEWIVDEWVTRFGHDTARTMLEAGNEQPAVVLRTNTARISVGDLKAMLAGAGIECSEGMYAPEALRIESSIESVEHLPGYGEGLFAVQDESSMLVAHVMGMGREADGGAVAGGAVGAVPRLAVDACAAPGGKATHMATLGGEGWRVAAHDVSPRRLELVKASAGRLGLDNLTATVLDARRLPGVYDANVNALLIDAPCTGLGVLARRPDARWRQTPEGRAELVALQEQILDAAAGCVAPGGTLVYSSCTVSLDENEDQLERFLTRHPEYTRDSLAQFMPTQSARSLVGEGWMVQMLPGIHGVDGFFIARMVRKPHS